MYSISFPINLLILYFVSLIGEPGHPGLPGEPGVGK